MEGAILALFFLSILQQFSPCYAREYIKLTVKEERVSYTDHSIHLVRGTESSGLVIGSDDPGRIPTEDVQKRIRAYGSKMKKHFGCGEKREVKFNKNSVKNKRVNLNQQPEEFMKQLSDKSSQKPVYVAEIPSWVFFEQNPCQQPTQANTDTFDTSSSSEHVDSHFSMNLVPPGTYIFEWAEPNEPRLYFLSDTDNDGGQYFPGHTGQGKYFGELKAYVLYYFEGLTSFPRDQGLHSYPPSNSGPQADFPPDFGFQSQVHPGFGLRSDLPSGFGSQSDFMSGPRSDSEPSVSASVLPKFVTATREVQQTLKFNYDVVESTVPALIYNFIKETLESTLVNSKKNVDAFDCSMHEHLDMPVYEFYLGDDEAKAYKFTKNEYILQKPKEATGSSQSMCYLAIKSHERTNTWIMGASFAKAYATEIKRSKERFFFRFI